MMMIMVMFGEDQSNDANDEDDGVITMVLIKIMVVLMIMNYFVFSSEMDTTLSQIPKTKL